MKPVDASNLVNLPKPKVTFRLLHQHEIAMGPGKAELLQAIDQTGSISAAGKSMKKTVAALMQDLFTDNVPVKLSENTMVNLGD